LHHTAGLGRHEANAATQYYFNPVIQTVGWGKQKKTSKKTNNNSVDNPWNCSCSSS